MPVSDVKRTRSAPGARSNAPAHRRPAPWLRSVEESQPAPAEERRRLRPVELVAVLVVTAAVVGFFVWFLIFASGGPGPGTV
jgi:hypothetical protein